ncbi:hypothetical protein [Actinoplanes sp. NPDC023714]|uniref:hypothetical protein n=1 Tax=Actinoplanes sp. NPDC023714 TaxID=3154322 RepID=UPI003408CEAF
MTVTRLLGVTALALVLAACSEPAEPAPEHGYVAGAEELSEPRSAIAYAADGGRTLRLLDLATTEDVGIGLRIAARELSEDGRFLYLTDGDRTLEIVDAGVWTVDHTDHVHYYRAPAKSIGTLTLETPITSVAGDGGHTAIGTAGGTVVVLDRRALESGEIREVSRFGDTASAVPYEDLLLAARDGQIVTVDAAGRRVGAMQAPCATPAGWVVLRGGALLACDTHFVRVKRAAPGFEAEVVPAPGLRPLSPAGFGFRPRSNEAAVADDGGIWSLNAPKATARHLPMAGVRAAASPADGNTVLSLGENGTLRSHDLASGKELAAAKTAATRLTLDVNRAYLTEPATGVIREIDYRDGLRTARTFPAAVRPDLAVEVGR